MKQKIVFVNRYFYPDVSATAQMLADLCFALAEEGRDVSVVTSAHTYIGRKQLLPTNEKIQGVRVYRCRGTQFGRQSLPGRLVDYLSFYLVSICRVWRLLRPDTVLVVKTDPPMLASVLIPIVWLRRAKLINWHQDIFPEIAGSLNAIPVKGFLMNVLTNLRDSTCRRACNNIVISAGMRNYLLGRGVPAKKLARIANWAPAGVRPVSPEANTLRRSWGVQDHFVIGYSGNLGRAHDWRSFLDLIDGLVAEPNIRFVFIGGGDGMERLRREVMQRGFSHVRFEPYQPRELLGEALSAIDLHLISLDKKLAPYLVPSKVYGIAAVGRPAIYIGPEENEVARLLVEFEFGVVVENGRADKLVKSALELKRDASLYERLSRNALLAHVGHFDFSHALSSWKNILAKNNTDIAEENRIQ